MVTGGWTLGNAQLVASYGRAQDGKGSAPDGTTIGALTRGGQTGAKQYTLGATYDLSKRTQLFGYYTKIDNDTNADYRFSINSFGGGRGSDPSGVELGIHHHF